MTHKVFLLEDEEKIRMLVARCFRRESFLVIESEKVQEAKICVEDEKFDIMILDLNLPDGNGEEIINIVKSNPNHHNNQTPIIVASAHLDSRQSDCFRKQGVYVLQKPFSREQLQNLVDKIIPGR